MSAKEFDQFYTQDEVAASCVEKFNRTLDEMNILSPERFYLEPSAGDGAFLRGLEKILDNPCYYACDIDPRGQKIAKHDFLTDDISGELPNNKTVVVIGNPPFGKKGKLASAFINRAFRYSKTVGFILPIQFNKYSGHTQINADAKLIVNESLPEECFLFNGKPYSVRCCFQIWTLEDVSLEDLRIRQSPQRRHPDFEMYQYNCTKEAEKFFDKDKYKWDFAVPRQGFKDYKFKETDPNKLDRKVQWIFFKAENKKILSRLMKIDYEKLSQKNSTIPGFGKADVVEEYERLYPTKKGESRQLEFGL